MSDEPERQSPPEEEARDEGGPSRRKSQKTDVFVALGALDVAQAPQEERDIAEVGDPDGAGLEEAASGSEERHATEVAEQEGVDASERPPSGIVSRPVRKLPRFHPPAAQDAPEDIDLVNLPDPAAAMGPDAAPPSEAPPSEAPPSEAPPSEAPPSEAAPHAAAPSAAEPHAAAPHAAAPHAAAPHAAAPHAAAPHDPPLAAVPEPDPIPASAATADADPLTRPESLAVAAPHVVPAPEPAAAPAEPARQPAAAPAEPAPEPATAAAEPAPNAKGDGRVDRSQGALAHTPATAIPAPVVRATPPPLPVVKQNGASSSRTKGSPQARPTASTRAPGAPGDAQPTPSAERPSPTPAPEPAVQDPELADLMNDLLRGEESPGSAQEMRVPDGRWFEQLFDHTWLRSLSPDLDIRTRREAAFIDASLELARGARILDLACGHGRHALTLARSGYDMIGLDLSRDLLEHALETAQQQALSLTFLHGDMRELKFEATFDGAYCVNSSLGYFSPQENFGILKGVCRSLKPGGRFLLEVINRDWILSRVPRRVWWEAGDHLFMEDVEFNYRTSTIEVERTVVNERDEARRHLITMRVYSLHECISMLEQAGLRVVEVSGDYTYRGAFLGNSSKALILLVERPEA